LTFDYSSWLKQITPVVRVLVHYTFWDCLTTFEVSARIEIVALTTGVEVSLAVLASAFDTDDRWRLCAARRAFHRLTKRHHLRRTRSLTILGL
jgi:hypothetical protein